MVDLYIAPIPSGVMEPVYPPQRQAQLEETKGAYRRQRYGVWKLLAYGLSQSLGYSLERLQLTLDDRGRWSCRECYFSLTHTDQAVAVAISDAPVGVDMEPRSRRVNPKVAAKLLSPVELEAFGALEPARQNQRLLEEWCRYESLFKWREAAGDGQPRVLTGTAADHCYAVATEQPEQLRLILLQEDMIWN